MCQFCKTHLLSLKTTTTANLLWGFKVLGIESSCDDSAAALLQVGSGVVHAASQQTHLHASYGGVVPELASRDHAAQLLTLVRAVLGPRQPDLVACTTGPGLAGCLVAGSGLAQALAYGWGVPLAQVNHLEGHLLSPFIEQQKGFDFPYLCLLASGGHTALYDVQAPQQYQQLGTTLDDAAGEAFDKTGILLGLGFPGGPQLERLARRGSAADLIKPAMRKRSGFDFSFSGLKSAARRLLDGGHGRADIAAAFQAAAITTIADRVKRALQHTKHQRLAIVGGVGRNAALRTALRQVAQAQQARLFHPPLRWCTDNAAMIAYAGMQRAETGYAVKVRPRWPICELS